MSKIATNVFIFLQEDVTYQGCLHRKQVTMLSVMKIWYVVLSIMTVVDPGSLGKSSGLTKCCLQKLVMCANLLSWKTSFYAVKGEFAPLRILKIKNFWQIIFLLRNIYFRILHFLNVSMFLNLFFFRNFVDKEHNMS